MTSPIITISTNQGKREVPAEDILRMESARVYTVFYERNGLQHVVSKNLGLVLQQLNDHSQLKRMFFRVHRQHVINLKEVKIFRNSRNANVTLSDQTVVNVAQRRRTELARILGKLNKRSLVRF